LVEFCRLFFSKPDAGSLSRKFSPVLAVKLTMIPRDHAMVSLQRGQPLIEERPVPVVLAKLSSPSYLATASLRNRLPDLPIPRKTVSLIRIFP
jgi:hypothetical protein